MKGFVFYLMLLFASIPTFSQCIDENEAYWPGEWIRYSAVYNWGRIWIDAGEVYFDVQNKVFEGESVYHMRGYGVSKKNYDWIYKVRDTFECYIDKQTLLPSYFRRNTSEGGYEVHNEYYYKYPEGLIFTEAWNSKEELKKDTFDIEGCLYDVLSMVYTARNIDYDQYEIGDRIPIRLIIDNALYELYIRYLGREMFTTRYGEKYKTIKFSFLLVEGTIFEGGEDMTVWVTDDENKIPVQVEAKILVGSVKAVLEDYRGTRRPFAEDLSE